MNIRSRAELIAAIEQGLEPEYLFFWGHTADDLGRITQTCLSQWWPSLFEVEGRSYRTAEHWMMAEKARLFNDEAMRAEILQAEDPATAKKLGRKVKNFDNDTWNTERFEIVVQGNVHKFTQNPELGQFLLGTESKILVEASPMDRIWGIGLGANNDDARNPTKWRGSNLLGFALMEARERLKHDKPELV